eukprot:SAG31_NODE_194_length_20722_cov_19.854192_12_plen_100_part_00
MLIDANGIGGAMGITKGIVLVIHTSSIESFVPPPAVARPAATSVTCESNQRINNTAFVFLSSLILQLGILRSRPTALGYLLAMLPIRGNLATASSVQFP